jgi:hypothetical protein
VPLTPGDYPHADTLYSGDAALHDPWDPEIGQYRCDSCSEIADWRHIEWKLYSCDDCVDWIDSEFASNRKDWEALEGWEDEEEEIMEIPPAIPAHKIMEANNLMILRRLTNIDITIVDTPDICMAGSDVLDSQTS